MCRVGVQDGFEGSELVLSLRLDRSENGRQLPFRRNLWNCATAVRGYFKMYGQSLGVVIGFGGERGAACRMVGSVHPPRPMSCCGISPFLNLGSAGWWSVGRQAGTAIAQ